MPKRDLLSLAPLTPKEIERLIDRASHYKRTGGDPFLNRGVVGLLFEKPSTRTRVAFETAVIKLGGHPIFLSPNDLQIKRGETIADTARVLGGYLDALVIRTHGHDRLSEWAASTAIPVINGLSDLHHPCQILADLFTIYEKRGRLKGLKLAYIGDGNNIAHSLMEGGAKTGMDVAVASPVGFMPHPDIVKQAEEMAKASSSKISITNNPKETAKDADIIYTDVWVSMGDEGQEVLRRQQFQSYQINHGLMALARPDALLMHCLPAHRGEEIADDLLDGKHSVIFEQAKNRLPMHQAILEWLIKK